MKPEPALHPFILCRHGETAANREGRILGQDDSPLLKEAEESVRRLGLTIARVAGKWDRGMILTSPLGRAFATAGVFSAIIGWPVEARESLKELSAGALSGGNRDEVVNGPLGIRQTWFQRPPGGESYWDGEKRLENLEGEIREILQDRPLLVVGHAGINRALLKRLLGLTVEEASGVTIPHDIAYLLDGERVDRLGEDGTIGSGLLSFESVGKNVEKRGLK
jgi:broad specificity phosphatase PhoE